MSSTISPEATLADLVVEQPSRSRVFEQFGLDYCCGGNRSLEEVCRERGIAVPAVLAALSTATRPANSTDWATAPIGELVDHIVARHHDGLREDLPRLTRLLDSVVRAHGDGDDRLLEVHSVFEELRGELDLHLAYEEQTVFPACRAIAGGGAAVSAEMVATLEDEHAEVGRLLGRLSELTDGYATENAECGTHRAAIDGLRELERDLHEHIHLENNVLFPCVQALVR